ncbi:MAG: hypothetical protein OXH11_15820 [Candidatus Aminicenantes bacterium]|nr:hypothetical protein [Candidatus Aminicenantes bacterium]
MSSPSPSQPQLEQRRRQIKRAIVELGDLRPGSLVARYRRCGKQYCHCAQPGARGHGPCYSLTRRVNRKTVTRIIPAGPAVERTQEQIAEYRRLRSLVKELVEVSEQICQAQLGASPARKGQKKGSKSRWRRRSSGKSEP